MHYLFLCILSSTAIFVIFKSIDRFSIPPFPVIVINYLVATLLGFLISTGPVSLHDIRQSGWLPLSIIIGVMFILMFVLVSHSSRKAGISVTTVASKMSVIFPVVFSLMIDPADRLTLMKTIALLIALGGIVLTIYKPLKGISDPAVIYIPFLLFAGMGMVDSLVKFAQHRFVNDGDTALFSAVLFLNAFLAGCMLLFPYRERRKGFSRLPVWGWGILLGGVNFGSIFFLVKALNFLSPSGVRTDSSVIFSINNMGIVTLSVVTGLLIFREQLRLINWVGILCSLLALTLFMLV